GRAGAPTPEAVRPPHESATPVAATVPSGRARTGSNLGLPPAGPRASPSLLRAPRGAGAAHAQGAVRQSAVPLRASAAPSRDAASTAPRRSSTDRGATTTRA